MQRPKARPIGTTRAAQEKGKGREVAVHSKEAKRPSKKRRADPGIRIASKPLATDDRGEGSARDSSFPPEHLDFFSSGEVSKTDDDDEVGQEEDEEEEGDGMNADGDAPDVFRPRGRLPAEPESESGSQYSDSQEEEDISEDEEEKEEEEGSSGEYEDDDVDGDGGGDEDEEEDRDGDEDEEDDESSSSSEDDDDSAESQSEIGPPHKRKAKAEAPNHKTKKQKEEEAAREQFQELVRDIKRKQGILPQKTASNLFEVTRAALAKEDIVSESSPSEEEEDEEEDEDEEEEEEEEEEEGEGEEGDSDVDIPKYQEPRGLKKWRHLANEERKILTRRGGMVWQAARPLMAAMPEDERRQAANVLKSVMTSLDTDLKKRIIPSTNRLPQILTTNSAIRHFMARSHPVLSSLMSWSMVTEGRLAVDGKTRGDDDGDDDDDGHFDEEDDNINNFGEEFGPFAIPDAAQIESGRVPKGYAADITLLEGSLMNEVHELLALMRTIEQQNVHLDRAKKKLEALQTVAGDLDRKGLAAEEQIFKVFSPTLDALRKSGYDRVTSKNEDVCITESAAKRLERIM